MPPLILSCSPRSGGNSDTAARLFASACAAPETLFLRDIPVLPCVACDACAALAARLAARPSACPAPHLAPHLSGKARSRKMDEFPKERQPEVTAAEMRAPIPYVPPLQSEPRGTAPQKVEPQQPGLQQEDAAKLFLPQEDKAKLLLPRRGAPFLGCPLSLKDSSAALLSSLALAPSVCITAPIYFYHVPAMLKALLDRMQPFWAMQRAGLSLFSGPRPCRLILIGARKRGEKLFEGSLLSLRCALEPAGLRLVDPLTLYGMEEAGDLAANARARELIAAYGADAGREISEIKAGKERLVHD